jgi:hypothetical protein
MRRSLALIIAAGLALGSPLGLASDAFAQKIDKNGRCHDAAGKFAKDEVCKGVAARATGTVGPAAAGPPAKIARCRDATTKKFVKCGTPGSVAVR